jgi:hypothetical protein
VTTLPRITEAGFLAQALSLARLRGYRVAHFRPARTRSGWRTPCQADAAGFPDLLLLKGGRMLVAELKVGKGKLTPEQCLWIAAFEAAGVPAYVWRPDDWPAIEEVLR